MSSRVCTQCFEPLKDNDSSMVTQAMDIFNTSEPEYFCNVKCFREWESNRPVNDKPKIERREDHAES